MKSSRLARLIHSAIQSFISLKKRQSFRSLRKIRSRRSQQINLLESLEPRMLLSGSSVTDDAILHVLPVATQQAQQSPSAVEGLTVNAPLSDTFSLNSNAGAKHTIYLDFTGHTTSGTYWNYGKSANLVTNVFSIDGDDAFSDTELQRIQNIWQRVAEDYIPFDVNVTTVEPPQSDLIKSSISDERWGVRVAIGGRYQDWYGNSAGGVAYLNSFNWSTDTPTFVFSETLYNNEKYVAEAISHEAGHTLNLSHDGTSSLGYYTGHGSGATGWAPIMGVGYYRELVQWSKGQYNDASQTQDDLSIITTNNGFGYRTDDFGNSLNDATALTLNQNSTITNQEGIIEQNTDTDWFSFTTTGGAINLSLDPFLRGPNLDILAELYNEAGQLVLSSNPSTLLDATLSTTLAAGTYYVKIDGIGKGNLSTGYSDYGSLGQYTISGTIEGLSGAGNAPGIIGFEDGNWWISSLNSGAWQTSYLGQFPVSILTASVSGDFNGDGVDDVAGWAADGIWHLGIAQADGTLVVSQWNGWQGKVISEVYTGDFNGDGQADLLGRDSNGYWWVAESQGNTFTTQTWAKWKATGNWNDIQIGDFNNDGKDDIASRRDDGRWWVALSNGTQFQTTNWGRWNSTSGWQDVSVGDFNGDGRADITGRTSSGRWWTLISQGNAFASSYWGKWSSSGSWNDVVVGDFNGDGNNDIAGRRSSGAWWAALSQGNTFTTSFLGQWKSTGNWNDVSVGDFNEDGKDDIAGRRSNGTWWNALSDGINHPTQKGAQWGSALTWIAVTVGAYNAPAIPATPPPAAAPAFGDGGQNYSPDADSQGDPGLVYEADGSSSDQTNLDDSSDSVQATPLLYSRTATIETSVEELFGDSNLLDLLHQI